MADSGYQPFSQYASVPESVRSRLAAALLLQKAAASSSQPFNSRGVTAAKAIAGGIGGFLEGRTAAQEDAAQAQNKANESTLAQAIMAMRTGNGFGGGSASSPPAPAAAPAPASAATAPSSGDERDLAIRTIYGEAGGEGPQGQAAVASVIKNRAASGNYGGSVRDVITAPKQFSLWNQGDPAGDTARKLDPSSEAYQRIGAIYDGVMGGQIPDPTNGADHYYNPKAANPDWGDALGARNSVVIGNHRFVGGPGAKASAPASLAQAVATQGGAPNPADLPAPNANPTGANVLPPGVTPDMISAASTDPALGAIAGAPPSGPAADYMLQGARSGLSPPSPAAGGVGASPALGTLPGPDTPLPDEIQAAGNMVPPNAIPGSAGSFLPGPGPAPPVTQAPPPPPAMPANPPLPPPGAQSLAQAMAARAAPPAGPSPDAPAPQAAPAGPAPLPPQNAAIPPGGNPAAPAPGPMWSGGHSPMADPSSNLNFTLAQAMAARGGSAPPAAPAQRGPLAQAVAQQRGGPAPAGSSSPGLLDSIGLGAPGQVQPTAVPTNPQELQALYAKVASDPRTSPQQLQQLQQLMMPQYETKVTDGGDILRIDPIRGTVTKIGSTAVKGREGEGLLGGSTGRNQVPFKPEPVAPGSAVFDPNNRQFVGQNPPTPQIKAVEGTDKGFDEHSGRVVAGLPAAVQSTTEAAGVKVPTITQIGPNGPGQTVPLTPSGGSGPLGGIAPLAEQAGDLAASQKAKESAATEAAGSLQKAADQGQEARGRIGELQQLQSLSKTVGGSGLITQVRNYLGTKGVDTSKYASDTQAYEGLRDYLSTQLRQAGSGALRNTEMDKLAGNLGSLSMAPEARGQSIQRMVDTFQRAAVLGDVAADPSTPPAQRQAKMHDITATWANAEAAIAAGKSPQAVIQKMQQAGYPVVGF